MSALNWEKSPSCAIWDSLSHDPFICTLEFCLHIQQKQALEVYFDIGFSDVFDFTSLQTSEQLVILWAVLLYSKAVVQQLLILARSPSISIFTIMYVFCHTRLFNNYLVNKNKSQLCKEFSESSTWLKQCRSFKPQFICTTVEYLYN